MKKIASLMTLFLVLAPAALFAQDDPGIRLTSSGTPESSVLRSLRIDQELATLDRPSLPQTIGESLPESVLQPGRAAFTLQEEIAPHLHFSLSLDARVDFPGDTSVDSFDSIAYSDIFDIGYGLSVEASLISWLTPHFAMGGYLAVGWDRFSGASDVDMGTGEFFSFGDQDIVTVIIGAKVVQKFAPFWFWEGRMGVGLAHYGELTFSDVTTPITVSGLQFFRPINRGLFDLAGRVGVGNSRVTFDMGLDFRFMGGAARGRDVTDAIDPDVFFVFAIDLGLSLRF